MNYFFELLDAYRGRGCCVTRIDENQNADPRLQNVAELIGIASKTPHKGTIPAGKAGLIIPVTVQAPSAAKQKQGVIFNLNYKGAMYPVGFTAQGIASADIAPGVMTQLFGPGPEEGKKKKTTKTQGTETTTPEITPEQIEKLREQQIRETNYQEIERRIQNLLGDVAKDEKTVCNMTIKYDRLVKAVRLPKATVGEFNAALGLEKGLNGDKIARLKKEFNKYYKKDPCALLQAIQNLGNPEVIGMLTYRDALENARAQMLTNQQFSLRTTIEMAFDDSLGEFAAKLLNGDCQPGQPCIDDREITDADKLALVETLNMFLELAEKSELTDDERILMNHSVRYTDTDEIAIAGATFDDSIVIRDRGRSFYDLVQHIAEKHGLDIKTVQVKDKGAEGGNANNAIGTFFEKLVAAMSLMYQSTEALDEESKKALENAKDQFLKEIRDLCGVLKLVDSRIKESERKPGGMTLDSYESRMEVLNNHTSCDELAMVGRRMQLATEVLVTRAKPQGVIHTGQETGQGTRPDLKFLYDATPEGLQAAKDAAKALGMKSTRGIQKVKIGKLLEKSPKFKEILDAQGLTGPGKPYDLDKEVYVVPVGLKTSSAKKESNTIVAGTSNFNSMANYIRNVIANPGAGGLWISNVKNYLGKEAQNMRVSDIAKIMNNKIVKKVDNVDKAIDAAVTKAVVDGKPENTVKLLADSIMDQLRADLDYKELADSQSYQLAKRLATESRKSNPDQEKIEKYKNALKGRLKQQVLAKELDSLIQSDKIEDRVAAATFIGMNGGVNRDQPFFYYDVPGQQLKTGDHNELAVAPLKTLINPDPDHEYSITDNGTITLFRRGLKVLSISQKASASGNLTGKTEVSDSGLSPIQRASLTMNSRFYGNDSLITEMVKMLRSQFVYLNKIFR